MRAFVAVELPEAAREALARLQSELGRSLAGWRFTPSEALHLTLRFLGRSTSASSASRMSASPPRRARSNRSI
jgi:2'-5' RNA ligase